MSEFIRRESELQRIPSVLVLRVSGFRESPEYRNMRDYELDIPGVVCGAFARYLGRIHAEEAAEMNQSTIAVASAHEAIETLASSSETAVRSLVTDEIFESLECMPDVLDRMKSHLKPKALALYQQWIGKGGV
jgi:hypothetical protein